MSSPVAGPLVSVIIPCFNAERYLRETLESVFRQTHGRLEIILVDDGSMDSTRSIIESLGKRVTPIYTPNRGAASARNTGTSAASGHYVQYLDADDLLAPHAIASRVSALNGIQAGVAYSDWRYLEEQEPGCFAAGLEVTRRVEDVHPDVEIALFTTFWAPPAALLYSKAALCAVGEWKQHLAPIEDARFMLDAAMAGAHFVYVPGVAAHYRVFHAASHSRRDPLGFVHAVFASAKEVETLWRSQGRCSPSHTQALAGCYNYAARAFFKQDPDRFNEALARLYAVQPGLQPLWPKAAGRLEQLIGHTLTLRLLALLGKPAS